ncbi:MAG: C-GCAxxG-C-C family protein [Candidatus Helarchaeota archaeon]|nr:C-GCAxxG-C-C family protein [Candidatus Helarchaeota archaeon]
MSKVNRAVAVFKEGYSCSQAILSTYGVQLGLEREIALKVASAFGGGMGRMGKTCGAVTGALMVLGLKHGVVEITDQKTKETTYALAREFMKKFIARNGSVECKVLLGCDLSTPEGIRAAKDKNVVATICPKLVQQAAEILEDLILK